MDHGVNTKMWGVDVEFQPRLDYRSEGEDIPSMSSSVPLGREQANLMSGLLLQPTRNRVGGYLRVDIFTTKQLGGDEDISLAFLAPRAPAIHERFVRLYLFQGFVILLELVHLPCRECLQLFCVIKCFLTPRPLRRPQMPA